MKVRTIKKRFNEALRKRLKENQRIIKWLGMICNEIERGAETGEWNKGKIKRMFKELMEYKKRCAKEINEISRNQSGPRFPFRGYA